jgi:hypothetical protein
MAFAFLGVCHLFSLERNCPFRKVPSVLGNVSAAWQNAAVSRAGIWSGRGDARFCFAFEQIRQERVSYYAQKQTNYRPNENATYRARLDDADTSAANDANCRKGSEDAATQAGNNKDRSGPSRESENNAAELLAKTAGRSEGLVLPTDEK